MFTVLMGHSVGSPLSFLEGPRWHDGRFWMSDFYTHRVLSVSEAGGDVRVEAVVPGQPSGLGWMPNGDLLVVSMTDRKLMRRNGDGTLNEHADLNGIATWHVNDMVVDSAGRAYAGNFGFDLMGGGQPVTSTMAIVEPDGTVLAGPADMAFPNGPVITPDGRTLIVAETAAQRLTAFDIATDGSLGNRRVWAAFGDAPSMDGDFGAVLGALSVAPDGICLDAEGCVWVADAFGNRAIRVCEGGEIVDEVSSGEVGTFACALGGADGRTLVLSTAPTFHEAEASAHHRAQLLATRVDVPAA
jgi:sugar lactone lactonase YvrE